MYSILYIVLYIYRENMKNMLFIYGIPTEIVNSILMLYKNTCSMVRSPCGDTPFFDITTGLLQGYLIYLEINMHHFYSLYVSIIY